MFIISTLSCLLGLHFAVLHSLLPQLLLAQSGSSLAIVFRLRLFRALVSFSIRLYRLLNCLPHFFLLPLFPLSQLGHTVQLALRDLSLLPSCSLLSPPSFIPWLSSSPSSLPSLFLLTPLPTLLTFLSLESAWAYCSARSWKFYSPSALSFSFRCPAASPV